MVETCCHLKIFFNDHIGTCKFSHNIMFRKKSGYKTLYNKNFNFYFLLNKNKKGIPKMLIAIILGSRIIDGIHFLYVYFSEFSSYFKIYILLRKKLYQSIMLYVTGYRKPNSKWLK